MGTWTARFVGKGCKKAEQELYTVIQASGLGIGAHRRKHFREKLRSGGLIGFDIDSRLK